MGRRSGPEVSPTPDAAGGFVRRQASGLISEPASLFSVELR